MLRARMALLEDAATGPVAGAERMDVLDAVRGAALLGILLVNVLAFAGLVFLPPPPVQAAWHDTLYFVVAFLLEGKFYALFSLLFGVGFAVFVRRAAARGGDAVRLFRRRLTGLLLIGLAHTIFIWMGDILVTYAVLGFALLPFLARDDRSVLRWAGAMLLLPVPLYALLVAAAALAGAPSVESTPGMSLPPFLMDAVNGFAAGSYAEVVKGNVVFTLAQLARRFLLMFFPRVFGMFLLGFYVGRRDMFADLRAHQALLRRVLVWGTVVGLPFSFAGALLEGQAPGLPSLPGLLETTLKTIGVPALSLGYAAGLCLLFERAARLRRAFAAAGQLALTNYLLQSVAGIVVFYGIGFGLLGRVPLAHALVGCLVFFAFQTIVSRLWLGYARFGPAEWAWRMFTYRRHVPLLRT